MNRGGVHPVEVGKVVVVWIPRHSIRECLSGIGMSLYSCGLLYGCVKRESKGFGGCEIKKLDDPLASFSPQWLR